MLNSHLADPLRASAAEVLRVSDSRLDDGHYALAHAIRDGDPAGAELAATDLLTMSLAVLNADEEGPR